MERSLTMTLARKFRTRVCKIYERYGTQIETEYGLQKELRVVIEREGKKPLVAQWGGIPLRWKRDAVLNDMPATAGNTSRTEIVQRLLADECELCGSHEGCQVHHIKALKDLQQRGRRERPEWVTTMASRRRKTLVVCQACHSSIHAGNVDTRASINKSARKQVAD